MGTGDILLGGGGGVTLRWPSIPSRGSSNTFRRASAKETGKLLYTEWAFGSCAPLPLPTFTRNGDLDTLPFKSLSARIEVKFLADTVGNLIGVV